MRYVSKAVLRVQRISTEQHDLERNEALCHQGSGPVRSPSCPAWVTTRLRARRRPWLGRAARMRERCAATAESCEGSKAPVTRCAAVQLAAAAAASRSTLQWFWRTLVGDSTVALKPCRSGKGECGECRFVAGEMLLLRICSGDCARFRPIAHGSKA